MRASLLYFNVDHVRDRLTALVNERRSPPRLIVFFMGNVPHADLAGAGLLIDLQSTFRRRGIEFRLAEVHGEVREALRRLGSPAANALIEAHQTVDDVVTKWRGDSTDTGSSTRHKHARAPYSRTRQRLWLRTLRAVIEDV